MRRRRAWLGLVGVMGLLVIVASGATVKDAPAAAKLRRQLATERVANDRLGAAYRREIRRLRTALHRDQVGEAITLASVVYGVSRRELEDVAWCEARLQPTARNGGYLGLFQLGAGFRARSPFFAVAGLNPYSPYVNALAAARVVARDGWREWECAPGGRG